MTRRTFVTGGSAAAWSANVVRRPNIVLILADDQRHDALGIAGHPLLSTPYQDRLAREGAWCRNSSVVCPLCAPSRVSFLTGLYGHTSGFRTIVGPWPERLPPTFLAVAHAAGYRTAHIGKKHFYNDDEPIAGVDRWVSFKDQGAYNDPELNVDGKRSGHKGHSGELLTDFAVDFIRAARPPFVLVFAPKEPHAPYAAPKKYARLFQNEAISLPATFSEDPITKPAFMQDEFRFDHDRAGPEDEAKRVIREYLRCIAALDDYTGRIIQALEAKRELDNTILVYTSDNGYFLGEHGRVQKMTSHEESVRIPLLIRYPAKVPAGLRCDEMLLNIDLAPTILDLAGLNAIKLSDGKSFRPLIKPPQEPRPVWRSGVYYEWQGQQGQVEAGAKGYRTQPAKPIRIPTWRALRTPRWKYTVYLDGDLSEFYDLAADPAESHNLSLEPSERKRVEAAHQELMRQGRLLRDPLLPLLPAHPSYQRGTPPHV